MPTASDELRAQFPGGDSEALDTIKEKCDIAKNGIIRPKTLDFFSKATEREHAAIQYLIDEWDYCWTSIPTAGM